MGNGHFRAARATLNTYAPIQSSKIAAIAVKMQQRASDAWALVSDTAKSRTVKVDCVPWKWRLHIGAEGRLESPTSESTAELVSVCFRMFVP